MPFPTTDRFKTLQQKLIDAEQIHSDAVMFRPSTMAGQVIGFATRTDGGHCLKVVPYGPSSVTTAGELTFPQPTSGGSSSSSTSQYYIKVFPLDAAAALVNTAYQIGQIITMFPYYGTGANTDSVVGTYVCMSTPSGSFVRFTSATGSGGLYQGFIQQGAATDYTLTTGLSDGPICIIVNGPERGTSAPAMVQNFSDFKSPGTLVGIDSSSGLPMVLTSTFQAVACDLNLTSSSSSGGGNSSSSSGG